jgi:hypothetical protein
MGLSPATRRLLFLTLCFPTRCALVFACLRLQGWHVTLLAIACTAIAIGFAVVYARGLRPTGFEAGGRVWWVSLRPVHAATYAVAAMFLFARLGRPAAAALAVDAAIGLGAFARQHWGLGT